MAHKRKSFWDEHKFVILTIISVFIGMMIGLGLKMIEENRLAETLIFFPGEIFMRLLKLLVMPLVCASLISALSHLHPETAKQLGLKTVFYYLFTASLATIVGLSLVILIQPGDSSIKRKLDTNDGTVKVSHHNHDALDNILDLIRNLLPDNIIRAATTREQTRITSAGMSGISNRSEDRPIKKLDRVDGLNILGIITFCALIGIGTSRIGVAGEPIRQFFASLERVMLLIIEGTMWFAPFGIASLVAQSISETHDIFEMFEALFYYVITVLSGLFIHLFLIIPTVYFIATRKNPFPLMNAMLPAFMTSLGTASSGAALPVGLQCMEGWADPRVIKFVLPLGASMNMDGNALYEAVAAIFIAQINGIDLGIKQLITISVTATLASAGLNAVPARLVSMFVILETVGLPVIDIALIMTVDWLLDRVRTAICTLADGLVASAVGHMVNLDPIEATELERLELTRRDEIEKNLFNQ